MKRQLPAYVRGTQCQLLWRVATHGSNSVHLLSVTGLERVYSTAQFFRSLDLGYYKEETAC